MNPFANRVSESPRPSEQRPSEQHSPDAAQGAIAPEPAHASDPTSLTDLSASSESSRQQPIPSPSSARQYRAIGLVRGKYQSQEQLTRGVLTTTDGTDVEAVLLGRVISLVKNHLDLEKEHLWVVYPRTRQENDDLHVQIVGVWEPETLASSLSPPEFEPQSGYFSIRGEIIFSSREKERVVVKIRQSPKRESEKPKFFKLKLQGSIPGRSVGNFWDLQIQLQGQMLVIQEATNIGSLPRKKKPHPRRKFEKPSGRSNSRSSTDRPKIKRKLASSSQVGSERKLQRPERPSRITIRQKYEGTQDKGEG